MMDKYAWQAASFYSAKRIIARKYRAKEFLAEELLRDVVKDIGETYDLRCYGCIIKSLSSDGFIEKAGFANAKTSHGSPKNLWKKSKSGHSVKRHLAGK